jgi:hypothetical protein
VIEEHTSPEISGDGGEHGPLRLWVLRTLIGISVLAVIALVAEAVWLRPDYVDAQQQADDRRGAIAAAERFVVAQSTYEWQTFETDYAETLSTMLSTSQKAAFETTLPDNAKIVKLTKMKSVGSVLASAVGSLDADSATILVVADASVSTTFDSRARHWRWEIELVKVDGKWLVDKFSAVE